MRKFLAIAAVAVLGLGLVSSPAAADPLQGILGLLNSGQSVTQNLQYQRQQAANQQQQILNRQNTVNQALIRACKAGDQYSCERVGPQADPRVAQITQALDTACQAGDSDSCSRAAAIRRQQIGYQR